MKKKVARTKGASLRPTKLRTETEESTEERTSLAEGPPGLLAARKRELFSNILTNMNSKWWKRPQSISAGTLNNPQKHLPKQYVAAGPQTILAPAAGSRRAAWGGAHLGGSHVAGSLIHLGARAGLLTPPLQGNNTSGERWRHTLEGDDSALHRRKRHYFPLLSEGGVACGCSTWKEGKAEEQKEQAKEVCHTSSHAGGKSS